MCRPGIRAPSRRRPLRHVRPAEGLPTISTPSRPRTRLGRRAGKTTRRDGAPQYRHFHPPGAATDRRPPRPSNPGRTTPEEARNAPTAPPPHRGTPCSIRTSKTRRGSAGAAKEPTARIQWHAHRRATLAVARITSPPTSVRRLRANKTPRATIWVPDVGCAGERGLCWTLADSGGAVGWIRIAMAGSRRPDRESCARCPP